jgi:hypothetical protein
LLRRLLSLPTRLANVNIKVPVPFPHFLFAPFARLNPSSVRFRCHDRGPHNAYNPASCHNPQKFSEFSGKKENTSPKRRVYFIGSSREMLRMLVALALEAEGDAQEAKAGNCPLTTELEHHGTNVQVEPNDRPQSPLFLLPGAGYQAIPPPIGRGG